MSKQNAYKEIAEKVKQAHALIRECEELARESGNSFSIDIAYGMGGTYVPRIEKDLADKIKEMSYEERQSSGIGASFEDDNYNDDKEYDKYGDQKFGWLASSNSC